MCLHTNCIKSLLFIVINVAVFMPQVDTHTLINTMGHSYIHLDSASIFCSSELIIFRTKNEQENGLNVMGFNEFCDAHSRMWFDLDDDDKSRRRSEL